MTASPLESTLTGPGPGAKAHAERDVTSDLALWLGGQIRKGAVLARLVQRLNDNNHHIVEEFDLQGVDGGPIDVRAMAELIYGTGLREANTFRTPVTYVVFSVRPAEESWLARYSFRIDLTAPGGTSWLQSDVSLERAFIAMVMQQSDGAARLSLGHSNEVVNHYKDLLIQATTQAARLLAQAQARIDVLEAREQEALDLRDKLQSLTREKEIQDKELARRHEFRMYTLQKIERAMPMLAGLLSAGAATAAGATGGAVPPPAPPEVQEHVYRLVALFAERLTPQQVNTLMTHLAPEQVQILIHLYDIVRAQKASEAPAGPPADPSAAPAGAAPAASATPPATGSP